MPTVHRDVGNLRITYVPARERKGARNWSRSDVVRIQAYRGVGKALHRGAEFPVKSERDFIKLIKTLCDIYAEGRP